jgi:bacillopeptidase F (M6 metalloprotease family)
MATGHDDVAYKRLARTINLTGATSASLTFKTSYSVEPNWDFVFVEARPVGTDNWTTLPDANGNTSQAPGDSCTSGWGDELHPQLHHYQTFNPDGTCSPTGTTGAWHAATGASDGVETWSIDLTAYAGQQVEVAISYATDWFTGDLGVFLDDTVVTANGAVVAQTSFEDGLGGWSVPGAPEGSAPNPGDWERVGLVLQVASVISTDDTLLFGFGFEGVETQAQRNEVMRRSIGHLIGAP